MNKKSKVLLYMLGGLVGLLLVLEMVTPQPINWNESYTTTDKIPFGAHILYDQLDDLYEPHKVQNVEQDPISFLKEHKKETNSNYLFINDYLSFDSAEVDDILDYVARGNKVFVATKDVSGFLADSLKLESNNSYTYYEEDTVRVRLSNTSFKNRSYVYTRGSMYSYLTNYDSTRTKVLGEVMPFNPFKGQLENVLGTKSSKKDSTKTSLQEKIISAALEKSKNRKVPQVNFVEIKVGKGAVYYHLNPIAFTNYYMLQTDKENYVAESLSYLNDGAIYVDNYAKSGKRVITSPMRFVLSQNSLRWAWYLTLTAILGYFLFRAKREQRAVPVIKALENSTVSFTRTISNLHYQSNNYTGAINNKIKFFLERVRTTQYLDTAKLDQSFINKLATKAGKPLDQTTTLVNTIKALRHEGPHNEAQLKQLSARLEAFLKE
jgi:hypothetical protein